MRLDFNEKFPLELHSADKTFCVAAARSCHLSVVGGTSDVGVCVRYKCIATTLEQQQPADVALISDDLTRVT
jgi:hypothetical protein